MNILYSVVFHVNMEDCNKICSGNGKTLSRIGHTAFFQRRWYKNTLKNFTSIQNYLQYEE